jgi:hypothetical protein
VRRLLVVPKRSAVVAVAAWLAAGSALAQDRPWDATVAASWTDYSQFDDTSFGLGLSVSRRIANGLAAEMQAGFSPSDLGERPFSGSRFEGYLGLRGGPHLGRHQVFAAVRPGFVKFSEAPAPIACIAIFPPPLACSLAAGETLFAIQLGGGLDLLPSERSLVRLEAGSLLVKYPGPAIARDQGVFDDALWSHNLRLGVSVGLRF